MGQGKGKKNMNKGKNPLNIPIDNLTRSRPIGIKHHKKAEATPPKKIVWINTTYDSITAAAKATGKSRTYISKMLKNKL